MGKTGKIGAAQLEYLAAQGSTIEYDKVSDTIRVCGVTYAMGFFRTLALAQPGTWLRIEDRDAYLTISQTSEDNERAFDYIAKKGRFKP